MKFLLIVVVSRASETERFQQLDGAFFRLPVALDKSASVAIIKTFAPIRRVDRHSLVIEEKINLEL